MINCEYQQRCCRYGYSRYLLEKGGYPNEGPPDRYSLLMLGFATAEMQGTSRDGAMFAEMFPQYRDNYKINICPVLEGHKTGDCHEYKREKRKEARKLERQRQFREKRPCQSPRITIPRSIRKKVAQRARFKCEYCGVAHNTIIGGIKTRTVVDHVVPLAMGGHPTDEKNLALACRKCNNDKREDIWERGCRINKDLGRCSS